MAESRRHGLPLEVIQSILPSNKAHLEACIESVLSAGRQKVGLLAGLLKKVPMTCAKVRQSNSPRLW